MERGRRAAPGPDVACAVEADTRPMSSTSPLSRGLCLAACLAPLLLAACTVAFTPGDAKPAVYTPYPAGAASGAGMP